MTLEKRNKFYCLGPEKRIENPVPTVYQSGDIVKILIGPATGRLGRVIVERNGNYHDWEPYARKESIAVVVIERIPLHPVLEEVVKAFADSEALVQPVVRWFDGPEQLELVKRRKPHRKA